MTLHDFAPTKIVAVGLNYRDHIQEMGDAEPAEPVIFIKPVTALIRDGDAIVRPGTDVRVDYEAELGVVIARTCKGVGEADALNYVLGYTCLNDVTARDLQKKDGQWTRGKGFDTFCPVGPHIETDIKDAGDLRITARLNGAVVQDSRTSFMIHSIPRLIAFISGVMTLNPGDIIATGTPSGIGPMEDGDVIEIEIEGIGVLTNTMRAHA